LRREYKQITSLYGTGFLADDLEEDLEQPPGYRKWPWAIPLFVEHQTNQLNFLLYAAELERMAHLQTADPQLQEECLKRAMMLYKESVLVGSRIYPDEERCTYALQQLRELCAQLHDSTTAAIIAQTYADNRARWKQQQAKFPEHI
jgi:hypothetical protein